jgi:diaminopropionate ammonia-lyase
MVSAANYRPNRSLRRELAYGPRQRAVLNAEANALAWREIRAWPGYAPTPLIELPGLAKKAGVGALVYKDEGQRFTLGSFKALGGAYAVQRFLSTALAAAGVEGVTSDILKSGRHRALTQTMTVAAATDGNHGRSVAWGAQMFHCRCIIYLHEHVSRSREGQIARYEAEIRRVAGGYDHSVHQCADDARANGWQLVADTSANGDNSGPSLVMQGYTLLAEELRQQTLALRPTHIFGPAAVGGLAAALVGHYWETDR